MSGQNQQKTVIAEILSIKAQIKELSIEAGLLEAHFERPFKNLETTPIEQLVDFRQWLQQLYDGPYRGVHYYWNLKPREWWDNMEKLYGLRNTREHRLLKAERKKLREFWYARHGHAESNKAQAQESQQDASRETAS